MAGQSNRSEAYDLALFEPKQAKIVELTPNKKLQNAYDDTMKQLKSEETRLQTELAQKLSAQSVDEYARSQGMTGIESEQIHYITRGDSDEVQVAEEKPAHWWDALFDTIAGWFS